MTSVPEDTICSVELLGDIRVLRGSQPITRFRTQKELSLLAFLALNPGEVHHRDRLIDLFWPDMDINAGRDNLSTTLSGIRRHLEAADLPAKSILLANRQTVGLSVGVTTDVMVLAGLLKGLPGLSGTEKRAALEKASALFRGEPLLGLYEDWAMQAQSRLNEKRLEVMLHLIRHLAESNELSQALDTAQELVTIDPYREESVRELMTALVRMGRESEALEAFQRLKEMLGEELGITPSVATSKLAERIRSGDFAAPETTLPETPSKPARPTPQKPALPLQLTRLFGRVKEIGEVCSLLEAGQSRVVTLTGPGGAGKTRLAIAVAEESAGYFKGGVWFVPLAEVTAPQLIPFALCNALEPAASGRSDPFEAAVNTLNAASESGRCLLVLDNLEQLLILQSGSKGDTVSNAATLVRLLLERVPALTCLATSRQSLRLGGEVEYVIPPLQVPTSMEDRSLESLRSVDAVALFADRAAFVKPGFEIAPENGAAVAEICRRLAGMPLGVEMAAAWVKLLTPERILERMRKQLDVLVNRRTDLPVRHQTMRATIAWSYDLLEPPLQILFASLSVFRGGAALEAVEYVCEGWEGGELGSVLEGLLELQSKSLLLSHESTDGMRFDMLEPLHEFALEKLSAMDLAATVHKRHAEYFLRLTTEAEPHMLQAGVKEWLNRLDSEADNVRAMLRWTHQFDRDGFVTAVANLRNYWPMRSALYEAMGWYEAVFEISAALPASSDLGNIYSAAANICWRWARYSYGKSLAERARAILEECGCRVGVSSALTAMANLLWYEGDHAGAEPYYLMAVDVAREIPDNRRLSLCLSNLALVKAERKDYDSARALFMESLEMREQVGNQPHIANILLNLGDLDIVQGRLDSAAANLQRCLELCTQYQDEITRGYALHSLGKLSVATGDINSAVEHLLASLEIRGRLEERFFVGLVCRDLAQLAMKQGDSHAAIRLFGLAAGVWKQAGSKLPAEDAAQMEQDLAQLRTVAGDSVFQRIRVETIAIPLSEAVAMAQSTARELSFAAIFG